VRVRHPAATCLTRSKTGYVSPASSLARTASVSGAGALNSPDLETSVPSTIAILGCAFKYCMALFPTHVLVEKASLAGPSPWAWGDVGIEKVSLDQPRPEPVQASLGGAIDALGR